MNKAADTERLTRKTSTAACENSFPRLAGLSGWALVMCVLI